MRDREVVADVDGEQQDTGHTRDTSFSGLDAVVAGHVALQRVRQKLLCEWSEQIVVVQHLIESSPLWNILRT